MHILSSILFKVLKESFRIFSRISLFGVRSLSTSDRSELRDPFARCVILSFDEFRVSINRHEHLFDACLDPYSMFQLDACHNSEVPFPLLLLHFGSGHVREREARERKREREREKGEREREARERKREREREGREREREREERPSLYRKGTRERRSTV